MKTSTSGKIALAVSEGIVNTAYLDTKNIWTFGIGHTIGAGKPDPRDFIGKKSTIKEIMDLFTIDLAKYEAMVDRNVKVKLLQCEFDALVHFVYNIGEPNFKKSKLLVNLNAGNKKEAWASGFHGWLQPPELKGRRDFERAIAQTGNYGSTIAPLYTATTSGKLSRTGSIDLKTVFNETNQTPTITVTTPADVKNSTPTAVTPKQKVNFLQLILDFIAVLFTRKKT